VKKIRLTKKKMMLGMIVILTISGMSYPLFSTSKTDESTVRNREFIAKKDNITVGVETSGQISTSPNKHTFEENTVVDDVFVKLGSEVKKGDKLASISAKNLDDLIKTAKDSLSDANADLLSASSEKDVLLKENDKKKQDEMTDIEQDYEAEIKRLTSDKLRVEKSIKEAESKIKKNDNQILDLGEDVKEIEAKGEALKLQINANIIKIGLLNERLLKVDDGSNKRQALNGLIIDIQYEIQTLNNYLTEQLNLSKDNQLEISDLEIKIQDNSEAIKDLEVDYGESVDDLEKTNISNQIKTLQAENLGLQTEIEKLSYSKEIASLKSSILSAEARLRNTQKDLNAVSDSTGEANVIRLEMSKLENANTAKQQELDLLLSDASMKELERLKTERESEEDTLKKDYNAFSLKLEEIQRAEQQFQQSLEKQGKDNSFSDYKVNEELKAINEKINKANRNVSYAGEKLNKLLELEKNPILYAQMDGIVTSLNYKSGDMVNDGKPLCIIGQLSDITLTVPVSAADIGNIELGQKANIYVDAFAELKFTGTVTERLLAANDNGDYLVTITIDPTEQMVLPGMKAFATIILKEKLGVLTISNKAIFLENGIQYVNIRNTDGTLVKTKVTTGFSDGRISEVLEGLVENDIAIVQE